MKVTNIKQVKTGQRIRNSGEFGFCMGDSDSDSDSDRLFARYARVCDRYGDKLMSVDSYGCVQDLDVFKG